MIGKSAMNNSKTTSQPDTASAALPRRHHLYEIDLERKTAFCTICGTTEIHVSKCHSRSTPKATCVKRFQEMQQQSKEYYRLVVKRGRPTGKPLHRLTEIDPEKMTAVCAVCGPTEVQKLTSKGHIFYACANANRAMRRKYMRSRYVSRRPGSQFHVLSQINEEKETAVCSLCGPVSIYLWQTNRRINRRCSNASVRYSPAARKLRRERNTDAINRYKVRHGCKRCGFNENLQLLYLYGGSPGRQELNIVELVKLTPRELKEVLEACQVYCVNCRSFANYALVLENLRAAVDY